MLGFSAISETAISAVTGAGVPPAPPVEGISGGVDQREVETQAILARLRADDDDLMIVRR